jgi:hypothetical protein
VVTTGIRAEAKARRNEAMLAPPLSMMATGVLTTRPWSTAVHRLATNAMRSARPTPLKQASIMWCVFSPVMVTWIAALRLSASDLKK